jgi:hypothetical protein
MEPSDRRPVRSACPSGARPRAAGTQSSFRHLYPGNSCGFLRQRGLDLPAGPSAECSAPMCTLLIRRRRRARWDPDAWGRTGHGIAHPSRRPNAAARAGAPARVSSPAADSAGGRNLGRRPGTRTWSPPLLNRAGAPRSYRGAPPAGQAGGEPDRSRGLLCLRPHCALNGADLVRITWPRRRSCMTCRDARFSLFLADRAGARASPTGRRGPAHPRSCAPGWHAIHTPSDADDFLDRHQNPPAVPPRPRHRPPTRQRTELAHRCRPSPPPARRFEDMGPDSLARRTTAGRSESACSRRGARHGVLDARPDVLGPCRSHRGSSIAGRPGPASPPNQGPFNSIA